MNEFEIENGKLIRYTGKATNIIIPDTVTSIGDLAFSKYVPGRKSCYSLSIREITIPESVTNIEKDAFDKCHWIRTITVYDEKFELSDFVNTHSSLGFFPVSYGKSNTVEILSRILDILVNQNFKFIQHKVPEEYQNHEAELALWLLKQNSRNKNLVTLLHNALPEIFNYLLTKSKEPNKPELVRMMCDRNVFSPSDIENYIWIAKEQKAFEIHDILKEYQYQHSDLQHPPVYLSQNHFEIENHKLLKYTGDWAEVVIPEEVETIASGAFEHCDQLYHLTVPESVTHIEPQAFHFCTALQRVTIFHTEMNMLGYYQPYLRGFCDRDTVMEFGADNFMRICINGEIVPYQELMLHNQEIVYRLLLERPKSENFWRMLQNDAGTFLYYLIEPTRMSDSAKKDNLSKEDVFQVMLEEKVFTESNIDDAIHWMIQLNAVEYQTVLINYKYQHFTFHNPADDLKL